MRKLSKLELESEVINSPAVINEVDPIWVESSPVDVSYLIGVFLK